MKKILFIINSLGVGGAERMLIYDINELVKRGDVELRLLTIRKETEKTLAGELLLEYSLWKTIPVHTVFNFFKIFAFIRKEKPDVIFSHLWYANTIARIAGFLGGCRTIFCFEQNVYDTIKSKKSFFVDFILQHFSHKIIAVSETVKNSLIRHGIKENKIEVIHNSVNIEKFIKKHSLTELLPGPYGATSFLFIGRLIPQKNVDVLIRAFKNVHNAVLYIVGQGYLETSLKNLVQELGLSDRIFFLGVRDDIPAVMQSCDCFVFPSSYEGFSLVLLEAMSAGMPIIITDFSAGKEIIIHEKNGIIVEQSEEGITGGCQRMATDVNLRKTIGNQAQETVKDFSVQRHIDRLMELIGSV